MTDHRKDAEVVRASTALVTGASGHIGAALMRLLTAAGYRVIGADRPGATAPPELGTAFAMGGGAADLGSVAAGTPGWIEVDLADPGAEAVLSDALAQVPRLDLVVAGAGVTALGDLESTADATFMQVMAVNYHGALRTTRAALPALRAARGHLVVISSVAGLLPVPGRPAYVGAKHAVTGTFLALAGELAPDGVTVTVVHPTFLRSAVTEVGGVVRSTAGVVPRSTTGVVPRSITGAALDADDVARQVVRLAARRRSGRRVPSRVLVGRTAYLADTVARIAPGLARGLAGRRLRPPPPSP